MNGGTIGLQSMAETNLISGEPLLIYAPESSAIWRAEILDLRVDSI